MRTIVTLVAISILVATAGTGLGGQQILEEVPEAGVAPDYLPEHIGPAVWTRHDEVKTFVGDSLFEYIDGAAEMYHKYDFVEVNAAEYHKGESVIVADVYRFTGADKAYGMYTTLRPEMPDTVMLGVEGFAFGANLVFVKGPYLANVYCYEYSDEMIAAVRSIATALAADLTGTTRKPRMFDIFPQRERVAFSEKIYAESFLGHGFLTDVYSVDYSFAKETFTLFAADDPGSAKLKRWAQASGTRHDPDTGYQYLPFDGHLILLTTDAYHGDIVAGVRHHRLLGMVGYRKDFNRYMNMWLRSFVSSPPR